MAVGGGGGGALETVAPRKRSRAHFGDDVYEMELQMHLDKLAHERKPPRLPAISDCGALEKEEFNPSLWGIKGSPYYKATVDEAVDSSTRMYRPWFSQFANRFVTIARKARAQDLTKIELLDPTFPKGKRHDGRKSRRAAPILKTYPLQ